MFNVLQARDEMNETVTRMRQLKHGESMVYHTGFLIGDRQKSRNVDMIATEAYARALVGVLALTQRRLGPPISVRTKLVDWITGMGPGFEYIATGLDKV